MRTVFVSLALFSLCLGFPRAGRFGMMNQFANTQGDKQARIAEKLAKMHGACPMEAAECGVPTEVPEDLDFAAMRATFQCLKDKVMLDEVSEGCAAAMAAKKQQMMERVQDLQGNLHARKSERLAKIHAACPVEAAECGVPMELPEEPDFAAMRATFQCLKDKVILGEVNGECAAAMETKKPRLGERFENSQQRRSEWSAKIYAACPVEAAECGVPTPEEVPEEPDFSAMRSTFQCLKNKALLDEVSEECAAAIQEKKQQMARLLRTRQARGGPFGGGRP